MTDPHPGVLPRRTTHALDAVNFTLADVRDGLGPYLSIYLLVTRHWDQASIGLVTAVGGIAAIVAQTPVGALVDRTAAKRALLVGGAAVVTCGSLAIPLFSGFNSIAALQALTGIAGSVFAPALAAITLGLVGPHAFARRIGRNESFNHAGNASAAATTAGLAYFFGPVVVFWVLAGVAALSVVATLRIPRDEIDHDLARGMDHAPGQPHPQPSGFAALLQVFAVVVVAFHFANAAMLPLVGQLLDGVGAGIFGTLFPLVVQDVTHGTGRFNVSLGAVTTGWGVGASLSHIVAGWIVVTAGYHAAFLSLAALAGAGFTVYLLAMPETAGARSAPAVGRR